MNIGEKPISSKHGMVTTICWSIEEQPGPGGEPQRLVDYALEGVIVTCGATIEWLKNTLELFAESRETEAMATAVPDNGGVYIVPAFSGLGLLTGKCLVKPLSRDSHLARVKITLFGRLWSPFPTRLRT
ncbi:hypothetical protein [Spirosoma telluris]|uniref:hypothetical protein n=1 Tax=Spirosoma telluris TaxID=2183553 RepID=UPI002FC2A15B